MIKKKLYGLKKETMNWYVRINMYLMSLDFTKSVADSNLYYKVVDGDLVTLVLYVYDLFRCKNKES